jgi:hypothetical protein
MCQIALILLGVVLVVLGISALVKGELKPSATQRIRGWRVVAISVVAIVAGLSVIAFALVGLPWMLRGP